MIQRLICSNKNIPFVQETWLDLRIFGLFAADEGKLPFGFNSTRDFSDYFLGEHKAALINELLTAQDKFLIGLGYNIDYYLDKTPNNYLILPRIYRESDKYILVKRCKKDVFLSYLFEMKYSIFKWWKYVYDIENFESYVKPFENKDNFIIVNYEDVVSNMDYEIKRLSTFLNIELTGKIDTNNSKHYVGDSRAYKSDSVASRKEGIFRRFVRYTFVKFVFTKFGIIISKLIYKLYCRVKGSNIIIH